MKIAVAVMSLLLLLGLITLSQAQKKSEPCANAETQGEMNICWGNQYKAADAKLNQVYRQFMTKLDDEDKAQLKEAQTAWLKYRDTNCDFVGDQYKGGTMRPMIAAICLTDVTSSRTKELNAQMKERDQ